MGEDVAELGGGQAHVERHQRRPGVRHAEVRLEQQRRVRRQHRDTVARFHPEGVQHPGLATGPLRERGVGPALLAVDHRPPPGVDDARCDRGTTSASAVRSSSRPSGHHAIPYTHSSWTLSTTDSSTLTSTSGITRCPASRGAGSSPASSTRASGAPIAWTRPVTPRPSSSPRPPGRGVVAVVHVQAAAWSDRPELETQWLDRVATDTGWPQAMVAGVRLVDEDAVGVVKAHRTSRRVRGVRGPRGAAVEPRRPQRWPTASPSWHRWPDPSS